MKPGERFPVHMAWTLPGGRRLRAAFLAEILAVDVAIDRLDCRLVELSFLDGVDDPMWIGRVREQVGKRVFVPREAAAGLVLPLKAGTLTGDVRYFYSSQSQE